MMTFDRQASVIAMCQSAKLSFWKAMGDSSVVDDEAEGFSGSTERRDKYNSPTLNLSQRAKESD